MCGVFNSSYPHPYENFNFLQSVIVDQLREQSFNFIPVQFKAWS